jgi:hypothetical protein
MKKFAVICATALALTVPGIAQAANPDGDHTFVGSLQVRKNIPSWTTCTVTAVVNVTGGVPKLKSVAVAGAGACGVISFSGLPSAAINTASSPLVTVPNVRVNIGPVLIFPADACEGPLNLIWGGNSASPRSLTFVDGTSNVPDANPDNVGATENACRIVGVLNQTLPTSTTLNL